LTSYALNPVSSRPYELTDLPGVSKYSFIEDADAQPLRASKAAAAMQESHTVSVVALRSGNIGYLKLTGFPLLATVEQQLAQTFEGLAFPEGLRTLVIDLRGNMGGYTETAEYLANLISTPSMAGKMMYAQHFNAEMQAGNATILKNQVYLDENTRPVYVNGRMATYADVDFSIEANTIHFNKAGPLKTVSSVYFLVDGQTASASELLINALKPYFPVTLVGSVTYGKPVGSFAIHIDKYSLHLASFLIRNASGEGDYFEGLIPDLDVENEAFGSNPGAAFSAALRLIEERAARPATEATTNVNRVGMKTLLDVAVRSQHLSQPEMVRTKLKMRR
jgi:C-terminal processing protease CtpA/Prc